MLIFPMSTTNYIYIFHIYVKHYFLVFKTGIFNFEIIIHIMYFFSFSIGSMREVISIIFVIQLVFSSFEPYVPLSNFLYPNFFHQGCDNPISEVPLPLATVGLPGQFILFHKYLLDIFLSASDAMGLFGIFRGQHMIFALLLRSSHQTSLPSSLFLSHLPSFLVFIFQRYVYFLINSSTIQVCLLYKTYCLAFPYSLNTSATPIFWHLHFNFKIYHSNKIFIHKKENIGTHGNDFLYVSKFWGNFSYTGESRAILTFLYLICTYAQFSYNLTL